MIFVWNFISETKGLSLEQVDELYQKCSHADKSPLYRKNWDQEVTTLVSVQLIDLVEGHLEKRRASCEERVA